MPSSETNVPRLKVQLQDDFNPSIKPMHMWRQVVVHVSRKPHAVERLRTHTITLFSALIPYNSIKSGVPLAIC